MSASTTTRAEPYPREAGIRIGAFLAVSVLLHAALIIAWRDRPVPAPGSDPSPVLEISLVSQSAGRAIPDQPPPPSGKAGADDPPEPATAGPPLAPSPSPVDRATTHISRQMMKAQPAAPRNRPARETAMRVETLSPAGHTIPAMTRRLEGGPPDESPAARASSTDTATRARLEQYLQRALLSHFTYPRRARKHGWQGSLKLGLRIECNGELTNIRVIESSGYTVLDHAALESARKIRIPESHRVAGSEPREMVIPVEFRLVDG